MFLKFRKIQIFLDKIIIYTQISFGVKSFNIYPKILTIIDFHASFRILNLYLVVFLFVLLDQLFSSFHKTCIVIVCNSLSEALYLC